MVIFHRDIFNSCGPSIEYKNNFTIDDLNSLGLKMGKN
jgi:hypothetical protein